MTKIAIIRFPSLFAKAALTLSATPPIGLAYLAGSLRAAGHRLTVVDAIGEAITRITPYHREDLFINGLTAEEIIGRIPEDTQIIFVSLPFSHEWPLAKNILSQIRKTFSRIPLIAGGEHATALPEFCLKDCPALDFIVCGEGEATVVELADALEKRLPLAQVSGIVYRQENGSIVRTPPRPRIPDIDDLPNPAWDLFPVQTYLSGGYSYGVDIGRTLPILASRGCPYDCTFCSNPQMWGCRWIARTPAKVVEEMEEYIARYQIQNFDFYDLTAIVRKDWIMEFCRHLIAKKLNITWQLPSGTRSEVLDQETTALLYQSGCRNISYAPESGSARMLALIRKKVSLEHMLGSMKAAVANGINVKTNIIVGFPDETLKDIFQTYRFIARMALAGIHDTSVWTFCAYPGSKIFEELKEEGRVPPLDDEYFFSLLSYSDIKQAESWNEGFSNRQLACLRLSGLLLFYFISYLVRPARLVKTLHNILRHQPRSRLEMIVEKAIFRHKEGQR